MHGKLRLDHLHHASNDTPGSGAAVPCRYLSLRLGGLVVLLGLTFGLATGCHWWRAKDKDQKNITPNRIDDQSGVKPVASTHTPQALDRKTTDSGPVERPGNPAAWGQGAQVSVGRQFEPIYFDATGAELNYAARQRLINYAQWFKEHPRVWAALAGHADSQDSVRFAYNLAMARALAVQDYLIGQGIERERFYPISFGEEHPAAEGNTPEAQSLNSRVEILAFIAPIGQDSPAPVAADKQSAPIIEATQEAPPAEEIP